MALRRLVGKGLIAVGEDYWSIKASDPAERAKRHSSATITVDEATRRDFEFFSPG